MRTKHSRSLMAVVGFALMSVVCEASGAAPDLDGDGIPNIVDPDIDNDGIPNALDKNVDGGIARSGPFAGQYVGDHLGDDSPAEDDIDGDDLADDSLGETDIDGDSLSDKDALEDDTDGDERPNGSASERDTDGDGRRNEDADEDDEDGDGVDDREDSDDDNDGVEDEDDHDHHPDADEMEVEQELIATVSAPAGSEAKAEVQRFGSGKVEFKVESRGLPAGSFDIVVAGVIRGTLVVATNGEETESEFDSLPSKPEELALDFEVFGEPMSLEQGGTVLFTGTIPFPPPLPGGEQEAAAGSSAQANLTAAAGLSPEAQAHVEARFGILGGLVRLEIEVENLPAGDYDLLVGAVPRATLAVMQDGDDLQGRLDFDSESADPEKLALTFPAAGETIVISQGGMTFFSGVIPSIPSI